jgi:hypothetical protein
MNKLDENSLSELLNVDRSHFMRLIYMLVARLQNRIPTKEQTYKFKNGEKLQTTY